MNLKRRASYRPLVKDALLRALKRNAIDGIDTASTVEIATRCGLSMQTVRYQLYAMQDDGEVECFDGVDRGLAGRPLRWGVVTP